MLEHYGRFQQSDFAKIAEACERVKREKAPMVEDQEVQIDPFFSENRGLSADMTGSHPKAKASLKASLYTAAGAKMVRHGRETDRASISPFSHHVLENKEHEGGKVQEVVSRVNCLDCQHGGNCTDNGCRWIRTIDLSLIRVEKKLLA